MSLRRRRALLVLPVLALLGAMVGWGLNGLPGYGHRDSAYAREAIDAALRQRHTGNTVNAVAFDVRGFDTLGEELILFTAAVGAAVLLRRQRGEQQAEESAERSRSGQSRASASLRALGAVLVGPVLVLGMYVIAHGNLTPGGGFQGGVILAGALLLVYAAGQVLALKRVSPTALVEVGDAVGAGAFVLIGIGGLIFAAAAMENFLPAGDRFQLMSSGTIELLNGAVGIEVASAVTLVMTELMDQSLLRLAEAEGG